MKHRKTVSNDPLSWAGSDKSDMQRYHDLMVDNSGQDVYKILNLKHKLKDDTYVEDALSRIANFLANEANKKGKA